MAKFRFTDEDRDWIAEELGRILFIQSGLRTAGGITPVGAMRTRVARGITTQLLVNLEGRVDENINGVPEAKARKTNG